MGFLRAAALFLASLWLSAAAGTAAPAPSEYQLKAVFLFNFAQFVEWPAQSFESANAPFVIAVVGEDPFGEYLDTAVRGETVLGHPLVIKRYSSVSEVEPCQILYISDSELARL